MSPIGTWRDCRFLTCSVLPVRMACPCECPFCFSRSSISSVAAEPVPWTSADLDAHVRWSAAKGATRMVVTGGGEPLLRPEACLRAIRAGARVFAEVTLFTNAVSLTRALADELRAAGLTYLCWSRHAAGDDANRELMGAAAPDADVVLAAVGDLPVRATCVMSTAGVADADAVWDYIDAFRDRGVRQFTFKHTYVARDRSLFTSSPANRWAQDHEIQADPFADRGEVIGSLPWGPTIRRIGEVQACHYYEPTPTWELTHRLARSSNLLSDGSVYASLEDRSSLLHRLGSRPTRPWSPSSTPVSSPVRSPLLT